MAADIFLKIAEIKGETLDSTYKDCIDVLSWEWDLTQSGSMHVGQGGGSGKVSVSDIKIHKYVDKATPNLIKFCCNGKQFPKAELIMRKAGGTAVEFVKMTLESVLVAKVVEGGASGDGFMTEVIHLNFAKFGFVYTEQDNTGMAGAPITMGHNIQTNTTT